MYQYQEECVQGQEDKLTVKPKGLGYQILEQSFESVAREFVC